jgi:four helix bundle protein
MAKSEIQSYRDLDAWKAAMELTVLTYEVTGRLPREERYGLTAQMRRATVSIPSNIAEGRSCGADGKYIHHVRIALGSIGELSTELELALRLGYTSSSELGSAQQQLARTRQLLFGLLRSLRKNRLLKQTRSALLAAFVILSLAALA